VLKNALTVLGVQAPQRMERDTPVPEATTTTT
jgi:hypothetical protein